MADVRLQIGTGLAGLTAAYLLAKERRWEVHVFEKADKLGVDAASVDVDVIKDGKSLNVGVDVPMRSIDAGTSRALPCHALMKRILSKTITTAEGTRRRGST